MNALLRAILVITLLAPFALAEQSADVSLAKEVDKYLEDSSKDTWQDPSTMRAFFKNGLNFERATTATSI